MCTGKNQYKAQKDAYDAQVTNQIIDQTNKNNVQGMKNDQYDIDKSDINLAFSQKAGAIQRNFGMEVTKFYQNNINAYAQLAANYAGPTGTGSRTQGRAANLAMLRQQAAGMTALKYADISKTEALNQTGYERRSQLASAAGRRGVGADLTTRAIAKPRGKSYFDQALDIGMTAASFATGIGGAHKALTDKALFGG